MDIQILFPAYRQYETPTWEACDWIAYVMRTYDNPRYRFDGPLTTIHDLMLAGF